MASDRIPALTLERFAELCELVDDGFAKHAARLAEAGVDWGTWTMLRDAWLPQLAEREIAARFGAAYAAARRRRLSHLALPGAVLGMTPGVETYDTEETSGPLPVLDEGGDADPPKDGSAGTSFNSGTAVVDPAERTIQAHGAPPPPAPGLSPPPSPSGHRRRLVQFDTQTGAPLANPYWVDEIPVSPR